MQRLSGRLREEVAYKNRTAQGALPRRSPGHIYFMQDNLLHTISKLSHEYFQATTKVLRIFQVA